MWFEQLVGFPETDGDDVRSRLELDGEWLTSTVSGRRMRCGTLALASLGELRATTPAEERGPNRLRQLVADVRELHRDTESAGATFQVASQFNLLEMVSPTVTPEAGIDRYERDRTQGPACAIACSAGTILRNYFAPIEGQLGQTSDRQLDGLADLRRHLAGDAPGWQMINGYAMFDDDALADVAGTLAGMTEAELDHARALLRVGVHRDVEVTTAPTAHTVTQVYCSALPVSYNAGPPERFERLARLVLEAAYEATLLAATGPRVYLTLLGGGVFGNVEAWIIDAIERALTVLDNRGLDVAVVSYGAPNPLVDRLVERHNSR